MMTKPTVQVRRIYEESTSSDGARVLVDGVWPRGMSKDKANVDEWLKQVAPSTELRKWYRHDQDKFDEFTRHYKQELDDSERAQALGHLRELGREQTLTLLTAVKTVDISHAAVLADVLRS
ncbi:MAG TPA: DUF488 family protein [Jiangellaceae bacterium]|nr:DUF488 family protein [Jiangellaceae bacterium]